MAIEKERVGSVEQSLPISPSLEPTLIDADVSVHAPLVDGRTAYITLLAAGVGLIGAMASQALIWLICFITNACFHGHFSGTTSINFPLEHPSAWVILIPIGGAIVIGLMARFGSRAVAGHGIPEAMELVLTNESVIPARLTFLKPVSAAISIGTGASVRRGRSDYRDRRCAGLAAGAIAFDHRVRAEGFACRRRVGGHRGGF